MDKRKHTRDREQTTKKRPLRASQGAPRATPYRLAMLVTASATLLACQNRPNETLMNHTANHGRDPQLRPFPYVQGDNLLGETYHLPVDFDGQLNLVLVAYYRRHQRDVDTWLDAAQALDRRYLGFEYYELPVIHRGYRFMRRIIDNGMRSGIPSREARRRTITLFAKKTFNRQLGVTRDDQIRALLVDESGRIRWSATGAATRESLQALIRAVHKHLRPPARATAARR